MNGTPNKRPGHGFPWVMMIGLAVPVLIGLTMFVLTAIGVLKIHP